MNRNNAAGYLNLGLACGIGLLYAASRDIKLDGRPLQRVGQFIGQLNEHFLLALILCGLTLTGVLFSLSRGGSLAALCGIAVTFLFVARGKGKWSLVVAAAVGVILLWQSVTFLNWLDPSRELAGRFEELTTKDWTSNGRIRHWSVAIRAGLDHLLIGSGIGTHRYAHLSYQDQLTEHWAMNADNQFVELFVECGLVGIGLVLLEILMLWWVVRRLQSAGHRDERDPIAVIALFTLVSQVVLAVFDFGITMPANAMTCTMVFAMLAATDGTVRSRHERVGLPGMAALVLGATLLLGVGQTVLHRAVESDRFHREVRVALSSDEPWTISIAHTDELLRRADEILANDPDNAELRQSVAELWVQRFRKQLYTREDQEVADDRVTPEQIWDETHLNVVQRQISIIESTDNPGLLSQLRSRPEFASNLPMAKKQLELAAASCPAMPDVDLQIARIDSVLGANANDLRQRLALAVGKAPARPDTLYKAGMQAFFSGDTDVCFALWKRYLRLGCQAANHGHIFNRDATTVLSLLATKHSLETIIEDVLPDYGRFYPRLLALGGVKDAFKANLPEIYTKMLKSLDENVQTDSANWHLMRATALGNLDRNSEALEAHQAAIAVEPYEMQHRIKLVNYLSRTGDYDSAFEEVSLCRDLAPDRKDIKSLMEKISRERNR